MNNNAIEERMSQILSDNNSIKNNILSQINDGGVFINNKKGEVTMNEINVQDINVDIETNVEEIDSVMDNDEKIPVISTNINVDAGLPVEKAEVNEFTEVEETTSTKNKNKNNNSKKKSKKNEHNLDEIEKEFIDNFNTMNHEMRFDHLVKMCGETAASSAKKLDLRPANRILESVRGNRLLKDENLNKVYMFYKNHPNLQNRPNVIKLLTPEFFVG